MDAALRGPHGGDAKDAGSGAGVRDATGSASEEYDVAG